MAHGVNTFDGAVWMNSPAIHLEIRSFADFAPRAAQSRPWPGALCPTDPVPS